MTASLDHSFEVPNRAAAYELLDDELFKLTLTAENKTEIFNRGLTKLTNNQHESLAILEKLDQWDPYTRALFELRSSSTILDTPFRLIYPILDQPFFDETGFYVRQYMAVSYCWRSEDFVPESYKKHGIWPVSKPFVDAMISEKNHPRVGIWMDQLCIDQSSSEDKRKSVAAMDIIYRSCIRLLVLLEDVFLDEEEVALHLKYDPVKMKYDPAWRPPVDEEAVIASFYRKVNSARWWQRAWCFHEFNVNEPWSDLRQCNEIHNATFIMNGPDGSTVKIKWWTLHYIMGMVSQEEQCQDIFIPIDHGDREPGYRSSVVAKHNAVVTKGCMLLEDRLSIILNMSGLALAYLGQTQRSTDEVLYVSAVLALAVGEAYPLTMFDGSATTMLQDRPSWFQRHAVNDVTIPRFRRGGLQGVHRVSMQEIELDMIFLPPPDAWNEVSEEDLKPTYEIFPALIATTRIATHGYVSESFTTASRSDADLDKPRRRFLAGCLLNGHSFTIRLWSQLKMDVVEPNYNQGFCKDLAPNPALIDAAKEFLRQLLPVSTLLNIPPPLTLSLADAQLFLTWLTDPRSMYYISVYTHCIQIAGEGQSAFVTGARVNAQSTNGPSGDLRAALPVDLLDVSCIPMRVWLLRPSKAEGKAERWILVGKALLLGEPDLKLQAKMGEVSDGASCKLSRVVVGGA